MKLRCILTVNLQVVRYENVRIKKQNRDSYNDKCPIIKDFKIKGIKQV